jgi:CIC family chloride channel protein
VPPPPPEPSVPPPAAGKAFLVRLLQLRVWLSERARPGELQATLAWAGLVGFVGGLASVLFRKGIEGVQFLLLRGDGSLVELAGRLPPWERLAVPAVGGLLAGTILLFGARLMRARGQAATDYMEAISLGNGTIRFRSTLVKSVSSLFTIASGGSIGREGPMVQLSAMLASLLGRRFRFSTPRLQLLVACGAAAGIASAYNAPIAGAFFVGEIVLGSIAMESFGPLVFASVVATVTVHQLLGSAPVYQIPLFHLVSNWELVPYLLLGLLAGVLGPVFLGLLEFGERAFARLHAPAPVSLFLGGLVVGALSLLYVEIWGNGYDVVNAILHGEIVWKAVLVILLLKVVATAATAGSGAVGGVFTPTLFVGAALGFLFGQPFHALWPEQVAGPSAYALVGMGCFLAATTHAPLMAILMLFEMTLDYAIVLPLMLACVTAYYTSRGIRPKSIYADSLRRKQPPVPDSPIDQLKVADLLKPDPLTVPEKARFGAVVATFARNRYNYLYVTDGAHRFRGAISLHDIKGHLNHPELAELVIALDCMREEFPVLTPEMRLTQALAKFTGHDGERLPVVASLGDPLLVGTLSKTDLLLTLSHAPNRGEHPGHAAVEAPGMPVHGAPPAQ